MLKEIAMFAILTAEDINDTIMLLTMLRTHVVTPWCCGGTFSICATH